MSFGFLRSAAHPCASVEQSPVGQSDAGINYSNSPPKSFERYRCSTMFFSRETFGTETSWPLRPRQSYDRPTDLRFPPFFFPTRSRRSRHIPVGICLDSPNVARRAALESATNGEKPARFGWGFHARGGGGGGGGGNGDDGAAKIDSRRRVDTQVFLSTGSEPTMVRTSFLVSEGGRIRVAVMPSSSVAFFFFRF